MKIAVVLQRYGEEILGGVEIHAQLVIDRLINDLSCEVDVVTTTAKSHLTWDNEYCEGITSVKDGLRIIRYDSFCGRSRFYPQMNALTCQYLPSLPEDTKPFVEKIWYSLQGVPNAKIFKHLRDVWYDKVIFFSYYFYTTIYGIPIVKDRAILIPTAHDEFQFNISSAITKMLEQVPIILASSIPEKELLVSKIPKMEDKIKIAGLGFDEYNIEATPERKRGRYFLFLGRADAGKGCDSLIQYFLSFCEKIKNVKLIFAGSMDLELPTSSKIEYIGRVSEQKKKALISEALAVVNLSKFESLSMIVIESMMAGTPLIVNSNCKTLNYYTVVTPKTVFPCADKESFIRSATSIACTDWNGEEGISRLKTTQAWAKENYSWKRVVEVFKEAIFELPPVVKKEKEKKKEKLAVIVPYRDRRSHLNTFVPYLLSYFEKTQKDIYISLYVIEQKDDKPFNRGKLLNVGFDIAKKDNDYDYVCFHDVDYLPLTADYSKPDMPTRLIWKDLTKNEDPILFFGAVVLFPSKQFIQVNGFSNNYRGWGFEDKDLHFRIDACGLNIKRRDQDFISLSHKQGELDESGNWLPEVIINKKTFLSIKDSIAETLKTDGLSTLKYEVVERIEKKEVDKNLIFISVLI